MESIAVSLKAVANVDRLAILRILLRNHSASVGYISDKTDIPFKSVSKHLGILYVSGLVEQIVDGQYRLYTITSRRPAELQSIFDMLI